MKNFINKLFSEPQIIETSISPKTVEIASKIGSVGLFITKSALLGFLETETSSLSSEQQSEQQIAYYDDNGHAYNNKGDVLY